MYDRAPTGRGRITRFYNSSSCRRWLDLPGVALLKLIFFCFLEETRFAYEKTTAVYYCNATPILWYTRYVRQSTDRSRSTFPVLQQQLTFFNFLQNSSSSRRSIDLPAVALLNWKHVCFLEQTRFSYEQSTAVYYCSLILHRFYGLCMTEHRPVE